MRIKNLANGLILVLLVSLASYYIASLSFVSRYHISPLIIGVIFGALASFLYQHTKSACEMGVTLSAKKLLRLGIILYGFNITLANIASIGVSGVVLSIVIVVGIFCIGYFIGTKLLGIDKEIAILVSGGSAICGAAAILALESSIRSEAYKGVIAVGVIVIFGLLGMFIYPAVYASGIIPLNHTQEGYYIGLTLHELANVVGAGGAISQESQDYALIIKMIRVLLLVPVLLVVPYCFSLNNAGKKRHLHIPWFAFLFLAVVLFHSFVPLDEHIIQVCRFISGFCLVMAMSALGLQIDFKKFKDSGGKAFTLGLFLFIILIGSGFLLVKFFVI